METGSHIKSLLQFQLASDNSAARFLPYCLSTLNSECLLPSSHRTKWTTRINSLLHSKEPSARWAGLCLAHKSSMLSQSLMIECAQSWLSVIIPMFTKNEATPTMKAVLRLLSAIFITATDITEFHRQVCVPNVVKVTSAILPFADVHLDPELKIIAMETLTRLIRLYPTAHRVASTQLMNFTLHYLNGSPTTQGNVEVVNKAAELYATLPLTGGKVGGVNLWRKSLEETLVFAWDAFLALRTTFPAQERQPQSPPPGTDPQLHIQLNVDRLSCAVAIFNHLLCAPMQRPVQLPIGSLIKLSTALLSVTSNDKIDGFFDPFIRVLEVATTPVIHLFGCDFLINLAQKFPAKLDPHTSRILTILLFQLEQAPHLNLQSHLLKTIVTLLSTSYLLDSSILVTRIGQLALQTVAKVVITSTRDKTAEGTSSSVKNGKKKTYNFEGDEVFKTSGQIVCPTREHEEVLLASIDVLEHLLPSPSLSLAMHSAIARVIISISLSLPRMSASTISQDSSFIHQLKSKIQKAALIIGQGTTSVMSKSLPFILEEALCSDDVEINRQLETLVHPRLPPLVRALPQLEALSLFKAEESREEAGILSAIAVDSRMEAPTPLQAEDVSMVDSIPQMALNMAIGSKALFPDVSPPQPDTQSSSSPLVQPQSAQTTQAPPIGPFIPSTVSAEKKNDSPAIPAHAESKNMPAASYPTEGEDDEEMPGINIDSDSEIDED
ncbi:rRNA processing/ribosome biogenesis-domain-containing protein [Crepidotus variabilis]|uniref:Pre-rRNA-processing protein RIX1 n=1 Tax=Crepidotus variabilis TaxID=179855 RepID=A0A9P6ERG9_9AGAR|nr:rRNA processing/ribosome biogenesis-domain-containing protein [Crepidotus variabilis]